MKIDGNTINDGLHDFKTWFSDFTIELSPLLILIGMLMTGVDIYLSGRLATQIWFEIPWAIAQVLAIDGLWFAVWVRILDYDHKRKVFSWIRFIGMALVGLAMVLVAFVMNDIVLFQQVNSIATSLGAMATLGIPIALFTHFRAMLLVATATLAMLFSRKQHSPIAPATVAISETTPKRSPVKKAMVASQHKAIPEQSSIDHSPEIMDTVAIEKAMHSSNNGYVAMQQSTRKGAMHSPVDGYVAMEEETDTHHSIAIVATGSQGYKDQIKAVWLRHIQEGRDVKLTEIASEIGIAYSTVKKWAASIREEIEQSHS